MRWSPGRNCASAAGVCGTCGTSAPRFCCGGATSKSRAKRTRVGSLLAGESTPVGDGTSGRDHDGRQDAGHGRPRPLASVTGRGEE